MSGRSRISRSVGSFLPLRERRVRGRDEHVWVAHQLDRLERPALERKHAEADVDLAALHELEQLEVVVRLHEPDVDIRPLVAKCAEQRGEDARPDRLVRADAERPGVAVAEGVEVGLSRCQTRGDGARVRKQQRPRTGQRDGSRAARAVDELLVDDALERCDLLGDGRLRVAEAACGAAERALVGDSLEGQQMPQFDAQPTISLHNRIVR